MKQFFCILLCLAIGLVCIGCNQTQVAADTDVTLNFVYASENIHTVLTEAEASAVIRILNKKGYNPAIFGTPACGFDANISLEIGDQVYAIACDTCGTICNLEQNRYFHVSDEKIEYIHALFESYGGYFPCV